MREDPIIFEDWNVGFSPYYNPKLVQRIDLLTTIIISLLNLYVGLFYEISFMVFIWIFILILSGLAEGLFDQKNRNIWDRAGMFIGLVLIYYFTTPDVEGLTDAQTQPLYNFMLGILFAIKLVLIPISESTLSFAENILVPKNKLVEDILEDQVKRLQSTEFEIESKTEFDISINKLRTFILFPFIIGIIIISILALLVISNNQLMRSAFYILFLGIMIINGLITSAVLTINYLIRRKSKNSF